MDANPTVDLAFRDYVKLSDRDREVIQGLIGQMTARVAEREASASGAEKKQEVRAKKGGGSGGKGA